MDFYPGTWISLIENPKTDIKEWVLSQKDILKNLYPPLISEILSETKEIEFIKLVVSQEDIVDDLPFFPIKEIMIQTKDIEFTKWLLSQKDIVEYLYSCEIEGLLREAKDIEFTKWVLSQKEIIQRLYDHDIRSIINDKDNFLEATTEFKKGSLDFETECRVIIEEGTRYAFGCEAATEQSFVTAYETNVEGNIDSIYT